MPAVNELKLDSGAQLGDLAPIKKAAILLVSIDKDVAATILRRMSREAVEDVTREIASLGPVAPGLRNAVVEEYYNLALARTYLNQGGLQYAQMLLEKSLAPEDAGRVMSQIEHQVYQKPFSFLQKAEGDNLMAFIQDEHPQTIALILAHVPPAKAADVLRGLPQEKQVEVVMRVA